MAIAADNQINTRHTLLSAVDELSGKHSLGRDKQLFPILVTVGVTEHHLCKRGSTSRVVQDGLDDPTNVSMFLVIVQVSDFSCADTAVRVGFEDSTGTLSLCTNYSTHLL
jgi:hypothetical protein